MYHYIITRFSVFDNNFKGFVITNMNNNINEYKENLFSEERLNYKFNTFELMTIPSINNQIDTNYIWLIYTSNLLPEKYKNRLNNITKNNDKIKILYINSIQELWDDIKNHIIHTNYTTIRLDDDDGLNPLYLKTLNDYNYEETKNSIVSFTNGIKFTLLLNKNEKEKIEIIYGEEIYYPKNAIGMTAFGINIFECGNHTKVDEKYNIIYNNMKDAYYICCSNFCDTKRELNYKVL